MPKKTKKHNSSSPGSTPEPRLIPISVRLPEHLVQEYDTRAAAAGTHRSVLIRRALERTLGRLPVPPVVPPINHELWMELRGVAADLHRAVRALEAGRTAALDGAVMAAARRSGELIDWLRHGQGQPAAVAEALEAALRDAERLNSAIHAHLTVRVEELDRAAVERTHQAVLEATRITSALSQQLLGQTTDVAEEEA